MDQLHGRDQSSNNESCIETVYTSTDSNDESTNGPSQISNGAVTNTTITQK